MKIPKMKKLTTAQRNSLPSSAFADPANRKYPVRVSSLAGFSKSQDLAYAQAAKKRGAQQESMGNLSSSKQDSVERKAGGVLKKGGWKPKSKNKINPVQALEEWNK